MPFKIVFLSLRLSRLKPYCSSTITAVKGFVSRHTFLNSECFALDKKQGEVTKIGDLHENTIAAKIITIKNSSNRIVLAQLIKITKQSLYKANSFACSLANRAKPVAATLQRKCSGGI